MKTHKIIIKEPIWYNQSIGINVSGFSDDYLVQAEIEYVNRYNTKPYPGTYSMPVFQIKQYPVQLKNKVQIHIIPIKDFIHEPE